VVNKHWRAYWKDMQKRICAQMAVAQSVLPQYRRNQKMVFIGIDKWRGNCGKSTFNDITMDTMDILALPLQPELLYEGARLGSRNEHGANELGYKSSLYVAMDEMKQTSKLDPEQVKKLSGGGITKYCRPFGAPEPVKFTWRASPFLYCNWGCVPKVDSSDRTTMERFRFMVWETMFATNGGAKVPKNYKEAGIRVKKADAGTVDLMRKHRGANMWKLLMAAYVVARDYGGGIPESAWPADWVQAAKKALDEADPLARVVKDVASSVVEQGVVALEGEQYTHPETGEQLVAKMDMIDRVKRTLLMNRIRGALGTKGSFAMDGQVDAVKQLLDTEMAAPGIRLLCRQAAYTAAWGSRS
jgi:hypothetical protein